MKLEGASIVFRADAGLSMGNGHVMRCLTLSDAMAARGARCVFISRRHPGHLSDTIRQRGFELIELPAELRLTQDAEQTATALAGLQANWLVVDHYGLTLEWEYALRKPGLRSMVIDDLADRAHHCHVLLDQNLGRQPNDYAPHVPMDCKLLIGPQHALVRPAFAERRHSSLRRREAGHCRRLLVALGGVDQGNVTAVILHALKDSNLSSELCVTIVLGPHAPWIDDVRAIVARLPLTCELKVDVTDMSSLMDEADLAIGAAGSSAWERCTLGLPTLLLLLADNQRAGAAALGACGAALCLESPSGLSHALMQMTSPEALRAMSRAAADVTDGFGVQRVVEQMALA